jgi:excisionase family DNA binding protein
MSNETERAPSIAEELLTPSQVAEIFQLHKGTILRWGREGVLTPVKISGTVRFRRGEVERVAAATRPT